jgi:hypothetical protein
MHINPVGGFAFDTLAIDMEGKISQRALLQGAKRQCMQGYSSVQ